MFQNVFNFFKSRGYEKEAFSVMIILTCISLLITLCFISEFGAILQQGILFVGICLKNIMTLIAEFDSKSPGSLSLIGALIGFFGALLVFYLQGNYQYNQDKKRLMILLLSVYENIISLYGYGGDYEKTQSMRDLEYFQLNPAEYSSKFKHLAVHDDLMNLNKLKLEAYSKLIYDTEWRKLVVTLKNIEDINFLVQLFLDLEVNYILEKEEVKETLEKISNIAKSNGYRKQIKFIDEKLRIEEQAI